MKVKECLGIEFLILHVILFLPYFLQLLLTTRVMKLYRHHLLEDEEKKIIYPFANLQVDDLYVFSSSLLVPLRISFFLPPSYLPEMKLVNLKANNQKLM